MIVWLLFSFYNVKLNSSAKYLTRLFSWTVLKDYCTNELNHYIKYQRSISLSIYIYIYTLTQELHEQIKYVDSPRSDFYRSEYQIKGLSKRCTHTTFSIIELSITIQWSLRQWVLDQYLFNVFPERMTFMFKVLALQKMVLYTFMSLSLNILFWRIHKVDEILWRLRSVF